jgi:hypothetical protein
VAPRRWILSAAALLVIGSLLLPSAAGAARTARFKVVAVDGEQTATWRQVLRYAEACQGEVRESGRQTIAFESTSKPTLAVRQISAGRGLTSTFGSALVRADWTFTREFTRSSTPNTCTGDPEVATSQAPDCGTQGPFPVSMTLSYKTGELGLDGILTKRPAPVFRTCEYEGLHELDLTDGFGGLATRKLFNPRRRTIEVHIRERAVEELADGVGSQTTVLDANVTLRRKSR